MPAGTMTPPPCVRACLEEGLDPDVLIQGKPFLKPVPLLVFATELLFVEGVAGLLERGARPDARLVGFGNKLLKNAQGDTALFRLTSMGLTAREEGDVLACAKELILAGASVDAPNWGLDRQKIFETYSPELGLEYKWISVREQVVQMYGSVEKDWQSLVELSDAMSRSQALEQKLPPGGDSRPAQPRPRF